MLKRYVAFRGVNLYLVAGSHQGDLSNIKHLVSISERGKREKVCSIKIGWAPCGRERVSRGRWEKGVPYVA